MKVTSQSRLFTARQLRAYLLGAWEMVRKSKDMAHSQCYQLTGTCRFTEMGHGLEQVETGQMRLADGQVLNAAQRYYWLFQDRHVDLKFADHRDFITLRSPLHRCDSQHLCGEDDYRVTYQFDLSGGWSSIWRVTGPRKNYVMTSHYSRR